MRMFSQCVGQLEAGRFVTPEEKYGLLRALPHLLVLIDGEKEPPETKPKDANFNVFKQKKMRLEEAKKLMKQVTDMKQG